MVQLATMKKKGGGKSPAGKKKEGGVANGGAVNKVGKKVREKQKRAALIRKNLKGGLGAANKKDKAAAGSTSARIPVKAEEASGNWKALLQTLRDSKENSTAKTDDLQWSQKKQKLRKKDRQRAKKKLLAAKLAEDQTPKATPTEKPDIWFDDVDPDLLDDTQEYQPPREGAGSISPLPNTESGLTKYVAMDCEMVGVASSRESIVARVSIVNQYGHCVYDKFVKPTEKVTDYRTPVSGIRPEHLAKGEPLETVQQEVADILKGRILVGHAIRHDLDCLFLSHTKRKIRDTSMYKPFRKMFGGQTPGLRKLTAKLLSVTIQEGEHNSVQDAQATMRIFTMYKQQWESELSAAKAVESKKKTKSKRKTKKNTSDVKLS